MKFIIDDIEAVVERMRPIDISYGQPMLNYLAQYTRPEDIALMPYYHYGHILEIANEIALKEKDMVYKYQKYPAIALRLDTPEPPEDGLIKYSLNIFICTKTDPTWTTKQKFDRNFKPVLGPLYDRFIKELGYIGRFSWDGDSRIPPHTPIARPYWGVAMEMGNIKNIFPDPIDAIEIIGLKINKSKKC